jgi:outer membrane murein-binding lipoprotein Lpp
VPRQLSFRDRFFTPKTARAITSPLGILLAGAGAAIGIVSGLGVVGAVGIGAAAWAGRVLVGMPKGERGPAIDAYSLSDPWKSYVGAAQSSKLRYDRTVKAMQPGPLRDRLVEVGARIDTGIEESWRVASRGDDIDGAMRELNPNLISSQLAQAKQLPPGASRDATVASMESQWASVSRLAKVREDASSHLRTLDARLDELVARVVELSVTGASDVGGLGSDVESMVSDMEALRQALDETKQAAPGVPQGQTFPST